MISWFQAFAFTFNLYRYSLGYLTKLTQLEELDLFGAKITDEGAAHLKHMPRLTSLVGGLCTSRIQFTHSD
jgi:hypothetical protein